MKIDLIIWDWNGTLLNDVNICVEAMNQILKKYNYKEISTDKYRKIFTFPVKDYYIKAGFVFENHPFEIVGKEFIDIYSEKFKNCTLQENTVDILSQIQSKGIKQTIISARENDALQEDIKTHKIGKYFDEIIGISNHYANGKEQLFETFLSKNKLNKENILLIGDTIHDCEIAEKFGLNFIQYSKGHQDKSHFADYDIISVDNLQEILNHLK